MSVTPLRTTLEDVFLAGRSRLDEARPTRFAQAAHATPATYPGAAMTLAASRLVAWHVFKENVRDRVLYSIAAFALLLVGGSLFIGQMTAGQDLKIIKDLGLATIELAGVLMSVFIGVSLVAHEIDRRSIFALLAKPLPRWEFIVGKYVGLVLTSR